MFKNALVSTSNKSGLIEFLKPMVANGLRVVSTGGTAKFLKENGIKVVEVQEQTGFPEVMDGRVRTLHPYIHMPLLAREGVADDYKLLKDHKLEPFDLVIVNLYPFESSLHAGLKGHELIEQIDIGGPTLLRAAAKNSDRIAVLCEPDDYNWIAEKGELTTQDRQLLAAKVFRHTSRYDALIAETLAGQDMNFQFLAGHSVSELRYGENPQQKAQWLRRPGAKSGLHEARTLHGKALSYNNILDLDAAIKTVQSLSGFAAVAVKHNNPCGAAVGKNGAEVMTRVLQADPTSVFGGIVATNFFLDGSAAQLLSQIFLECVVAPAFTPEALQILTKKKDIRLLEWKDLDKSNLSRPTDHAVEFRTVAGGYLVQESDHVSKKWDPSWQVLGPPLPEHIQNEMLFAWAVCAQLKSNAIAITEGGQTIGMGMGQVNRVEAVEHAIARARQHHAGRLNTSVLASDAFFPFADSIQKIQTAGIKYVIQPGGSIRDPEVIAAAQELGVTMVLTGRRHFRH